MRLMVTYVRNIACRYIQMVQSSRRQKYMIDADLCRYHMTSIYDISVYEGLSRVIQRLIPQQPALERLLNGFALVSLFCVSYTLLLKGLFRFCIIKGISGFRN